MASNAQILDVLLELKESVGTIKGDVSAMKTTIADRGTRLDTVETRVRKVENRQHWYSGAGAAIGAVFGIVVKSHTG